MTVLYLIQSPEQVASSRTRAFAYLPFLRAAGIDCRVLVWNSGRFISRTVRGRVPVVFHLLNLLHRARTAARMLIAARGCETIYIQKVVLPGWLLRLLHRRRRIVFDYDDAMYALAPAEDRGWRAIVRRWRTRRFTTCLRHADLVVVENEPNRRWTEPYCRRTLTITGPIDTDRYRPASRAPGATVVLGWIGSPSTTAYLRMLEPVLEALARRGHPIAVHLVGAGLFTSAHVPVRHFPWSLDSEVGALGTFDIGLMPLTDDAWARGKGGYKILQYMAMGIPTVASPVGINVDLVEPGITGFLADGADQWVDVLDRLIADPGARQVMGAAARDRAVARHSLVHHAPIFARALTAGEAGDRREPVVSMEGVAR